MRTVILPQNPSPVAILFKDGGGLANHPQGMFRNQENKINEKQRKKNEEKKSWRNYSALFFHQKPKVQKVPFCLQGLSLYKAPNEVKYQHTLKKALYKEGKSGTKRKQNQKVKIWAPNDSFTRRKQLIASQTRQTASH